MTDRPSDPAAVFRPDGARLCERVASFIRTGVCDANADGVVIVMDGGSASSIVATLAVEALGSDRVYGLVLPSSKLGSRSAQDAEAVAEALEIDHDTTHLQPLLMCFADAVPDETDLHGDPIVRENLVARLRMAMAYLAANATDRLVVGSATRTERLLGSVAKFGDGAADLLPLGGLYGTETNALAAELDLPSFVTEPRPTVGQSPRDAPGAGVDLDPEAIDAILYRLVDAGWDPDRIEADLDVEPEAVDRIVRHHRTTGHKRRLPPTGPAGERVHLESRPS
jgi:NAD+ synthase